MKFTIRVFHLPSNKSISPVIRRRKLVTKDNACYLQTNRTFLLYFTDFQVVISLFLYSVYLSQNKVFL